MHYLPPFYLPFYLTHPPPQLAKQLATALNTCVVNGVDHRDLSQDNILYNPATKQIKLVGFGHATSLSHSKEP